MVEYHDGAVVAQLGMPTCGGRLPTRSRTRTAFGCFSALDLALVGSLTFEEPDRDRFPCLTYAFDALKAGSMPAVLSAANEVAIKYFLEERYRTRHCPRDQVCYGRPCAVANQDRGRCSQSRPLGAQEAEKILGFGSRIKDSSVLGPRQGFRRTAEPEVIL